MKETLIIENFGGLKKMEFEFKRVNVLIGPQASGKSISVKLLYFFKNFPGEMLKAIENGESKRELDSKQKETFNTYFPKESWPKGQFKIQYQVGTTWISISRKASKPLAFSYSENLKNLIIKGRRFFKEEQKKIQQEPRASSYKVSRNTRIRFNECIRHEIGDIGTYNEFFVPAGRSFFANVQSSIFSFLSNNKSLDPFLIEFGSFYENFKRWANDRDDDPRNKKKNQAFDKIASEIISGSFQREKDKDYIFHDDSRKVNLANASSGQQETLPLILVLKTLGNFTFSNSGATIYIEEPEAHLFPTAQKKVVQLLARTFNSSKGRFQIIVTTHSPYILSSFNNLLEAGKIISESPQKTDKVHEVISADEVIMPEELVAYSIFRGQKKVLIDSETSLISSNALDDVSDEIAEDFGKLLDIEF